MKTAIVTISVAVSGDEVGGENITESVTLSNTPAMSLVAPLTNGRANIFPGVAFSCVLLIPPTNSTVTKTWDASSTTGGPLSQTNPALIFVPPGTTSINVSASGSENLRCYFW